MKPGTQNQGRVGGTAGAASMDMTPSLAASGSAVAAAIGALANARSQCSNDARSPTISSPWASVDRSAMDGWTRKKSLGLPGGQVGRIACSISKKPSSRRTQPPWP
jgi:hypothetical protein